MAIIFWPKNQRSIETVLCAICKQEAPISEVSAGSQTAEGQQAFACNKHFEYGSEFIAGWADFAATQQPSASAMMEARKAA